MADLPTGQHAPPDGVKETPVIILESDRGLTPRKIAGFLGTAALVIALPVIFTVAIGIYQTLRPEKIVSAATPKDHGLAYEDAVIRTADGIDLAAWYVPAKKPSGAAVLVLHGYPADKGDVLPRTAFLAEDHDLLYIDFRWLGRSGGSYTTGGPKEVLDADAALGYLRAKGIKKIGIYGFSMGGSVALMTLGRPTPPDAVVAEAAYGDLRSIMSEQYRYLGPLKPLCTWLTGLFAKAALGIDLDRESPAAVVAGTKAPVLLIHSRKDKVVPFEHAEMLRNGLSSDPAAEFWFMDDVGHGEPTADFVPRIRTFFNTHLKPATQ